MLPYSGYSDRHGGPAGALGGAQLAAEGLPIELDWEWRAVVGEFTSKPAGAGF